MNVLVVYAHPEPASFVGAMKEAAVRSLVAAGHTVEVSDLYAEGFNPVAGRGDFLFVKDPQRFHYQAEQLHASANDGFAEDLRREQERVAAAQMFVFLFPLWWGGMPAILKGWFDRVLAYGFAYADGKRYESGFFHGRHAIIGMATGGTRDRFSEGGSYGSMEQVLHGVQHCMLEYLGLEVASPFVAYAAPRIPVAQRQQMIEEWAQCVAMLADDVSRRPWQGGELHGAQHKAQEDQGAWAAAQ